MTEFLHGPEYLERTSGIRPVQATEVSSIGIVGTAPGEWTATGPVATNAIDEPVLVRTRADAGRQLGVGVGTLPDAVDAIFAQGIAPRMAIVNVLDPASHRRAVAIERHDLVAGAVTLDDTYVQDVAVLGPPAAVAEADHQLAAGTVDLGAGYISDVVVKNQAGTTTYDEGDDYTVDPVAATVTRVAGGAIAAANAALKIAYSRSPQRIRDTDYTLDQRTGKIEIVAGGALAPADPIYVGYQALDPTAVTAADVAGGTTPAGTTTGVAALVGAGSRIATTPDISIAPGWSDQAAVSAALVAVADRVLGTTVIEGPDTDDAAAVMAAGAIDSRRAYFVDPGVRVEDEDGDIVTRPASAYAAGVIARTDRDDGWWSSPSNKAVFGIKGTTRDVDYAVGDAASAANTLNAGKVATFIREDGFRLWGNRTLSSDSKWQFLSVVRIADRLRKAIMRNHLWAVDRGITKTYLTEVARRHRRLHPRARGPRRAARRPGGAERGPQHRGLDPGRPGVLGHRLHSRLPRRAADVPRAADGRVHFRGAARRRGARRRGGNPVITDVLRNINAFVDGRGYAGRVLMLQLPKLTVTTDDHRAGGMDGTTRIDMGLDPLEAMLESSAIDADLIRSWGWGRPTSPGRSAAR